MDTKKNAPSWSDVTTKLADFDRAGLIGLVADLYAASRDTGLPACPLRARQRRAETRHALLARLDAVRHLGHDLGYGVGDDMDDLLARSGFDAKS